MLSSVRTALVLLSSLVCVPAVAAPADHTAPNIIIILADDLGYGDIGAYGATLVRTPHLDSLARDGVRFTDTHSPASVCTPVRYALLTGREYYRAHTWGATPWDGRSLITPEVVTLPELLKTRGYRTGCFGKWHLGVGTGGHLDWNGDLKPGPVEAGCDRFFGLLISNNIPPYVFVENHRVVGLDPADPMVVKPPPDGGQIPVVTGGNAARFKSEDLMTRLTEEAVRFIGNNRNQRFFLYFGTSSVHLPVSPHPRFHGTSGCGRYCDAIHELDWAVGEVLGALDRYDLEDRTLVIFASDNGGVVIRDVMAAGHHSNGPLLGQKTDVWEGGHRIPLLARWPGRLPAGEVADGLFVLTDLPATIAGLLGIRFPEGAAEDSFNLAGMFEHPETPSARPYFVIKGSRGVAIRRGPWWFFPEPGSGGATTEDTGTWWLHLADLPRAPNHFGPGAVLHPDAPPGQLYNLAEDVEQQYNVYREHPELVSELQKFYNQTMAQIRQTQLREMQRAAASGQ